MKIYTAILLIFCLYTAAYAMDKAYTLKQSHDAARFAGSVVMFTTGEQSYWSYMFGETPTLGLVEKQQVWHQGSYCYKMQTPFLVFPAGIRPPHIFLTPSYLASHTLRMRLATKIEALSVDPAVWHTDFK